MAVKNLNKEFVYTTDFTAYFIAIQFINNMVYGITVIQACNSLTGVYLERGVRSERQRRVRIYRGNLEGGCRILKNVKHMKDMIFMMSQTHLPNVFPWN